VLEDDAADHPLDAPEGADATRILAGEAAGPGDRAAGGVGGGGRGRRGLRKRQQVVGVHGGDQHAPEDEQTRNVQVRGEMQLQTLGIVGVAVALLQWTASVKNVGETVLRCTAALFFA
jgi:hypothetical protein